MSTDQARCVSVMQPSVIMETNVKMNGRGLRKKIAPINRGAKGTQTTTKIVTALSSELM